MFGRGLFDGYESRGISTLQCSGSAAVSLRIMIRTLEVAIEKIGTLPPDEQDRIARWLLDELQDEEQWTSRFSNTQASLSQFADEVRTERSAGRISDLDPDKR